MSPNTVTMKSIGTDRLITKSPLPHSLSLSPSSAPPLHMHIVWLDRPIPSGHSLSLGPTRMRETIAIAHESKPAN